MNPELLAAKKRAAIRLREEYTDVYGRQTLYKAALSDPSNLENPRFDSENQNLWSGQAMMFLYMNKLLTWEDIENFHKGLSACKLQPGLYSRYPLHYNTSERHGISHDEMTGISVGSIAVNEHQVPQDMINYGKKHNWVFLDENPTAGLFDSFTSFKKYVGRVRQPKDRALYKIAAEQNPSIFECLNILVGSYLSSKDPATTTTGRIMWFHKFKAFEIAGVKSRIIGYAKKLFHKNCIKAYGHEEYMDDVYDIYFQDLEHPFHDLVKGLKLC